MKRTFSFAAGAAVVLACAAAMGTRHVLKADGQWMETLAERGFASPLEWEHAGRILDEQGTPVTGAQTLVVRLYGAPEGGDALWARKVPALLDANGNYSVRLCDALEAPEGAPDAALDSVLCANACWIECQIDGHPAAMSPRAALAASPYALFADGATGSRGDFDVPGSLAVTGETQTKSLTARNAEVSGGLDATGTVSVGGNVSAAGGLKAGALSGVGPVPVGTIILWHGDADAVPSGWAVCDGQDGRPNLSGRFPVGAGHNYQPGDTGGAATVSLSWDEMPSHAHGYELRDDSNRDEPSLSSDDNRGVWKGDKNVQTGGTGGTSDSGDHGAPHENLPPYKALWYIVRVE